MKKTVIIIGVLIGIVGIGYVTMYKHNKSDNTYKYNNHYSQGHYHKDRYKEVNYSNNFTEVDGVPF